MVKIPGPVATFLQGRRMAVAGVSRQPNQAANAVFRKLKASGYEVFPINPNASEVEGVPCYADVGSVPAPLDGVVIATSPPVSVQVVRQCGEHGVQRVWFHRSTESVDSVQVGRHASQLRDRELIPPLVSNRRIREM